MKFFREFWIYPVSEKGLEGSAFAAMVYDSWAGTGDQVHVTEKVMYDKTIIERDDARNLERQRCNQIQDLKQEVKDLRYDQQIKCDLIVSHGQKIQELTLDRENFKLAVIGLYNSIKLNPHVDQNQELKFAEEILNLGQSK